MSKEEFVLACKVSGTRLEINGMNRMTPAEVGATHWMVCSWFSPEHDVMETTSGDGTDNVDNIDYFTKGTMATSASKSAAGAARHVTKFLGVGNFTEQVVVSETSVTSEFLVTYPECGMRVLVEKTWSKGQSHFVSSGQLLLTRNASVVVSTAAKTFGKTILKTALSANFSARFEKVASVVAAVGKAAIQHVMSGNDRVQLKGEH
jgi:hypothetical protein